jgi:hypothetical protein
MTDLVSTTLTEENRRDNIMLNVALSDNTGQLIFSDPGDEGGKLIGSKYSEIGLMSADELIMHSQCKYSGGEFKSMTVDYARESNVTTYTLDLLVSSLEGLNKIHQNEEIFIIKIDTEGRVAQLLWLFILTSQLLTKDLLSSPK